jgi:DNA polymerase-3 subunit alpha
LSFASTLGVYSTYSILDGENRLDNVVSRVKELGMKQVALTDHGTMMGVLEFYKKCKKIGIKPLLGCEAYITSDIDCEKEIRNRDNNHLVLIAENDTGYRSLLRLVSTAQTENMYYKPRISKEHFTESELEGLIATSACLGNEVNRTGKFIPETKTYEDQDKMEATALWYFEKFKGKYYLEIQDNDDEAGQQKAYNEVIIKIARKNNIPLVITSDAHYTKVEDSKTHSMLMATQLDMTIDEYSSAGQMKYGPWFYIRSPEEMLIAAKKYNAEDAFWNACEIGNKCNVNIVTGVYKTPVFDIKSQSDYSDFLKQNGEQNES